MLIPICSQEEHSARPARLLVRAGAGGEVRPRGGTDHGHRPRHAPPQVRFVHGLFVCLSGLIGTKTQLFVHFIFGVKYHLL